MQKVVSNEQQAKRHKNIAANRKQPERICAVRSDLLLEDSRH